MDIGRNGLNYFARVVFWDCLDAQFYYNFITLTINIYGSDQS